MMDKRYDNRPRINYNFDSFTEPRLSAQARTGKPRRTGSEPRDSKPSTAFRVAGKAGREFPERKRSISEAESLLAAALAALG